MTALERLYPGDVAVALAFCAALQVAGLVALGGLLARGFARRHPAAAHAIWRLVLLGVVSAPLVALVLQRTGVGWIELAWLAPSPPAQPAGDSAEVLGDQAAPGQPSRPEAADASDVPGAAGFWPDGDSFASVGPPGGRVVLDRAPERTTSGQRFRAVFGALAAAWAVGALVLLARLIWGWTRLARLRRRLVALTGPRWRAARRRAAQAMGLSEIPPLAVAGGLSGPIGFGVFHPVIVLPEALARRLDDQQLHDILVHETAHFLHHDHLFGLVQRVAELVYWPHPMVYWLGAELDRAREDVCDNHVLASGQPARYARMLLELSRRSSSPRAMFSAIGFTSTAGRLERRVARFFDSRRRHATGVNRATFALLGAAVLLAAVSTGGVRLVARSNVDLMPLGGAAWSLGTPSDASTETAPAALQTPAELATVSGPPAAFRATDRTLRVASAVRSLDEAAAHATAEPIPEMRIDAADGQFRVRLRAEGLGQPALWVSPGVPAELSFGRDASDGEQETGFALRITLEAPEGEPGSVVADYQLDRVAGAQRQRWQAHAARWPLGRWTAMRRAVAAGPAATPEQSLAADSGGGAALASDALPNVAPASDAASVAGALALSAAGEATPTARAMPVIPGFWLLRLEAVQEELELTALQRQRLWELGAGLAEAAARDRAALGEITDEAVRAQRQAEARRLEKARNEHAQAEVVRLLAPEQLVRLGEIEFRMKAPASLADPRVLDELGVDPAQRRQLADARRRMEDGLRRLQREAFERDVAVLSREQIARLKAIYFPDPTDTGPRPAVTADASGAIRGAEPPGGIAP